MLQAQGLSSAGSYKLMPRMLHAGYASGLQEALHGAILFCHTPGREHCSSRGLWHKISDTVYRGQSSWSHIQAEFLNCMCLVKKQKDDASMSRIETLLTETFREMCLWHLMHHCKSY